MAETVIRVDQLRKAYGQVVAVDGVSLEVQAGEIVGLVGPNGAGKTTTIECLEGLRRPDSGQVTVLGHDPWRADRHWRARLGAQLQRAALPDRLKVWEALDLYASFYPRSVDWRPLLDRLGLADKTNDMFCRLSGGQQQRLFIALALVNDPELVFLDEITTGLDPQARHGIWDLVHQVRDEGKTVFLTTHYMEEAERLCDRVAIIDHGRIVAMDSPEALIRNLGVEHRVVLSSEDGNVPNALRQLASVIRVEAYGPRTIVYGRDERLVVDVVERLLATGIRFRDLRTEQANLEDVFLSLTGREMRD